MTEAEKLMLDQFRQTREDEEAGAGAMQLQMQRLMQVDESDAGEEDEDWTEPKKTPKQQHMIKIPAKM